MPDLRVAVDVGGTFTDVCVFDDSDKTMHVTKVPSTPEDPMQAVISGIERAAVSLEDVQLLSHGTTVATNALITRRFPKAAMVTTEGFRDVIEIRDGTKDDLWDAYNDVSGPYLRRRDRFEVPERIDFSGNITQPLDEDAVRRLGQKLKRREVTTVAVCFLNSYANPSHEVRAKELLQEELPEADISTSAEILPEIFEYDRFNTAVANALLGPLVSGYVERLDEKLKGDGYGGDLLLLHSGGGSMTPAMVKKYPVRLAASGIAAGAIAAQHVATQAGYPNAIGLDMGGTSTDISLVHDGEVRITKNWEVEYGHPIVFPSIEVLTIGAGGGSLAHIDIAGSLRNGPQSAGATPGPACYNQGGDQPTNTDANLLLNRLGTSLAGGAMTLKRDLSEQAVKQVISEPLEMGSSEQAAQAILQVANANMADAVRLVSIRRGYDPRDFALVAFGGAGALHGADVAKELGIPTVLVPPNPGVTSALGCLLVDVQHDLSMMYPTLASEADRSDLERQFRIMQGDATERLRQEGVDEPDQRLERAISMRYAGQWRSLQVIINSATDLEQAIATFHEEHERQFAFRQDSQPVEIYQLHLKAVGKTPKPAFVPAEPAEGKPEVIARRDVYFEGSWIDTAVYDRDALGAGMTIQGPAIIEQLDATTVVPPEATAEIDEWLNIRIHLPKGKA
ncbi:hydantoinase/oxoprolinase family protein [Nesterenkonia sp. MY13]|uniref:Hydantoinase/oxoprolinase family protein n=1 Tax=Nesterenkonia sedimenti TaxID=1463632 RepID=A0A7X8TIW8_9MICC|nr:hydantoinase/oxoprolinase family protein [Nesterenkonia sedimenti]NLS09597.1 hydantoinase/oxoprolinase family protein [Nesterenkonia sedimenti]